MTQRTGNSDPRVIAGIRRATDLGSRGDLDAAVRHLLALTEEFPAAASLHGYVALFLSRAGRLGEAIEHGRRATQLSPRSEKASLVLFKALWTDGRRMEALDEMKRYLALRPSTEYTRMIREWGP